MKVYKYWARGEATVRSGDRPWTLQAYGGSNEGIATAQRQANEMAARAAAALERGSPRDRYGYSDRPLREEIVELIVDANEPAGVITRNSYGALVLNTERVMFVDVDDGAPGVSNGLSFRRMLRTLWIGFQGKPPRDQPARHEQLFGRIERVVGSWPGLGLRVYRTAAGFRLLITSSTFVATSTESDQLLMALGADPLYMRLCKTQECYRARLSAKFWRCGATRPPFRYPWANDREEAQHREWEQSYHRVANAYATCELLRTLGEPVVHADVAPILEAHDRLTICPGAPLA